MKNEKGITLVSLITYVIGMIVIMIIIASALSFYNKNMAGINNASDANLEFNKFNNRMIQETKEKGNKIEDVTKTTIKFSNGNVYTFADNKIYLGKVQISKYVKEFSAKLETEGEKQLLKVYILVGKGNEELAQNLSYTIEYVTNKAEGGLTQVGKLEEPTEALPDEDTVLCEVSGSGVNETKTFIIPTGVNVIKVTFNNTYPNNIPIQLTMKNSETDENISVNRLRGENVIYVSTTPSVEYEIQVSIPTGSVVIEYSSAINNQTPEFDLTS